MGKKTFITFFKNLLKNIQLKPKKPKKTQYPKWDFKVVLGFLGLNPPPIYAVKGFLYLDNKVYRFTLYIYKKSKSSVQSKNLGRRLEDCCISGSIGYLKNNQLTGP